MDPLFANLIESLENSTLEGHEAAVALRKMIDDVDALDFERTALRAERDELLASLKAITHYAECALAQFTTGRGTLDISAFHSLTKEARAVIAKATGA